MHTLEAEPLEQGDERAVYGMDMFRSMCETQYGLKSGAFKFQVDRKLQDGENLEIGGMTWGVLHIPGHSQGSIGLYDRADKTLIPGDVVYADYAIGRFDLHGANGAELKDSLVRLAELEVGILLPGHNRIVKDLPEEYILQTARQWEPYLA
jgi:glyoxylase-like metal-dependent hydrolase (beta-lactamase superfamily II)